jgi:hypothetical protein
MSSVASSQNPDPEQRPLLPHSTLEIAGARSGLLAGFDSLRRPYRAYPVLASNRHVETIFAAFTRSLPAVTFRRECLRAPDDGAVALDWVSADDRALPPDAPLLILLVCVFLFGTIAQWTRRKRGREHISVIGNFAEHH